MPQPRGRAPSDPLLHADRRIEDLPQPCAPPFRRTPGRCRAEPGRQNPSPHNRLATSARHGVRNFPYTPYEAHGGAPADETMALGSVVVTRRRRSGCDRVRLRRRNPRSQTVTGAGAGMPTARRSDRQGFESLSTGPDTAIVGFGGGRYPNRSRAHAHGLGQHGEQAPHNAPPAGHRPGKGVSPRTHLLRSRRRAQALDECPLERTPSSAPRKHDCAISQGARNSTGRFRI